jgi:hypothetical protein
MSDDPRCGSIAGSCRSAPTGVGAQRRDAPLALPQTRSFHTPPDSGTAGVYIDDFKADNLRRRT